MLGCERSGSPGAYNFVTGECLRLVMASPSGAIPLHRQALRAPQPPPDSSQTLSERVPPQALAKSGC